MKLGLKLTDDSDLGRQMVRKHKAIKKCGSQKYETINNELYKVKVSKPEKQTLCESDMHFL